MKDQNNIIRISVRDLVTFLLRSGSLDTRSGPSSEAAMLEGARIHRALQKKAGEGYRAEVALRLDVPVDIFASEAAEHTLSGDTLQDCDCAQTVSHDVLQGVSPGDTRDIQVSQERFQDVLRGTVQAVLRLEGRADGIFFMSGSEKDPVDPFSVSRKKKKAGAGGSLAEGNAVPETSPVPDAAGGLWTIDEIKTVFGSLRDIEEPKEVHLAQARCYAYMYARGEGLDRMKIRMTYCSQVTGEVRCFYEEMSFAALEEWFAGLIRMYEPWVRLRLSMEASRQETIRQMVFPFPYREGQYELAAGVYRTIVHEKKLFLQAPTGTGKTMAVLFPALKAIGEGKAERIFYLTAKGVAGSVALEALSLLHQRGLSVRSLSLVSKERACPFEQADCRPETCPRADGHFDRVNRALWELLREAAGGSPMTAQTVAACAEKHNVCPYSLSQDAADFADVIVCDYNYVFHPQARLQHFFGDRSYSEAEPLSPKNSSSGKNGTILLIDEAHNLLERGRDMYSAEISYPQVRRFRKSVKTVWPRLWKKMKGLVHVLRQLAKEMPQDERSICVLREWTSADADPDSETDLSAPAEAAQAAREDPIIPEVQNVRDDQNSSAAAETQNAADARDASDAPDRRSELYSAVEEVRDQIQWILEQENRSAALYGTTDHILSSYPESTGKHTVEKAGLPELLEFYFEISHFSQMLRDLDDHYIVYVSKGAAGGRGAPGEDRNGGSGGSPDEKSVEVIDAGSGGHPVGISGAVIDGSPARRSGTDPDGHSGRSRGGFSVHLYCADPSGHLRACMAGVTSAILFSATFLPIQYYKGLLGGTPGDFEMYARSSFPPARRKVVIVRDVTSRYRDRNEENYARIARSIGQIVTCRPGNYMVYFPSYAFLENVLTAFRGIYPDIRSEGEFPGELSSEEFSDREFPGEEFHGETHGIFVLPQRREMKDAERAAFLEAFEDVREDRFLIGFCVLGGMFGEGIDLRNDRLIGSLIVGTGIPPVEPKRELLREYFAGQGKNGYDFAYRFPGMNKVLQAAGRVIRTAEDVGIVVLMDARFSESANRGLFPLEWESPESIGSGSAAEIIRRFWGKYM